MFKVMYTRVKVIVNKIESFTLIKVLHESKIKIYITSSFTLDYLKYYFRLVKVKLEPKVKLEVSSSVTLGTYFFNTM